MTVQAQSIEHATSHFNSHAHVERDVTIILVYRPFPYFNSHAHVERDPQLEEMMNFMRISTHTLTWSVTQYFGKDTKNGLNFNSHAHVERDCKWTSLFRKCRNFNSHAHVERDTDGNVVFDSYFISTHTLTWSVTKSFEYIDRDERFQLTRSRGA